MRGRALAARMASGGSFGTMSKTVKAEHLAREQKLKLDEEAISAWHASLEALSAPDEQE